MSRSSLLNFSIRTILVTGYLQAALEREYEMIRYAGQYVSTDTTLGTHNLLDF